MNRVETIQKLSFIEHEFDVNSLTYLGIRIWPLLRMHLNDSFKSEIVKSPPEVEYQFEKSFQYLEQYISEMRGTLERDSPEEIKRIGTADAAFLVNSSYREHSPINGKSFHRFYDSLKLYFPSHVRLVGLEYHNQGQIFRGERFSETYSIQYLFQLAKLKSSIKILEKNCLDREIADTPILIQFFAFLKTHNIYINVNLTNFLRELDYIAILRDYLANLISQLKAKVLFVTASYNKSEISAILAARRLGITTIELQHGQQGDDHFFYTNWNRITKSGYDMLPDEYWLWNNRSKKRIDGWCKHTTSHRTHVVGNFWISAWREQLVDEDSTFVTSLVDKKRRNILVAVQPINIEWFLEEIEKVVHALGDTANWLFRFHPSHPDMKKKLDFATEKMKRLSADFSVEWSQSTKLHLYSIIQKIDLNITQFSSVAYEAQFFGKPSILLLNNQEEFAKDFNDIGFYKTYNATAVVDIIKKDDIQPPKHMSIQQVSKESMSSLLALTTEEQSSEHAID